MVWNEFFEVIKPEGGHLGQDLAFVGNSRRQDNIESGKPVGSNDEKVFAEIVNVTDVSASVEFYSGNISL